MSNRVRNNRFDVEWQYAKACLAALRNGEGIPPVPQYSIWAMNDDDGSERLIGKKAITPAPVTHAGCTVFAR